MTFEELEDLFLALEINLNPSTFHGLLCGQLCWNDEKIDSFMTESADIFSISVKLFNNIDTTHISLITLAILIIFSMSWLVLKTLREGRKALTEMNKDRS